KLTPEEAKISIASGRRVPNSRKNRATRAAAMPARFRNGGAGTEACVLSKRISSKRSGNEEARSARQSETLPPTTRLLAGGNAPTKRSFRFRDPGWELRGSMKDSLSTRRSLLRSLLTTLKP